MIYLIKYPNFSLCLLIGFAGAFKVNTSTNILGVHGLPAVLECTYPPTTVTTLNELIITWQRVKDNAVVHSFYQGQDQLSQQDSAYHDRTSLFQSKFLSGNVSLRLDRVSLSDEGLYLCSVSSNQGSDKGTVSLTFTAFYTEPRLSIKFLPSQVNFLYESRGYPKSEVMWTDVEGREITDAKVFSKLEQGLVTLIASLTVDHNRELNYTFTMRNQPLGQIIQRHVAFRNGAGEHHKDWPLQRWIYIVFVFFFFY